MLKATYCPDCVDHLGLASDMVEASCDFCGVMETHHGDLHKVTVHLKKFGWTTKPGKTVSAPMRWACRNCK